MKSQIIIEFSLMLAAIALFSMLIMQLINIKMGDNLDESSYIKLQEYAKNIQSEFTLAYVSRDGYQRDFIIPNQINNKDFDINIQGKFLILNQSGRWVSLVIPNVNGTLKKGENTIINKNGYIKIN